MTLPLNALLMKASDSCKIQVINNSNLAIFLYSPSPEYPADCWSETEIPPGGAAGSFIKTTKPHLSM